MVRLSPSWDTPSVGFVNILRPDDDPTFSRFGVRASALSALYENQDVVATLPDGAVVTVAA